MAEPEWHRHHPLKQNMSQKPERWDQNHYCILPGWKRRSVLGHKCKGIRPYFQMHYIICFVIFEQLWSRCYKSLEQIFSMSATSETPVGEIYLHLSFKKKTWEYKSWVSWESLCFHMCIVNLRISLNVYCSCVRFDWCFFFPPRRSVAKAVTPRVSKLLIEDKQ